MNVDWPMLMYVGISAWGPFQPSRCLSEVLEVMGIKGQGFPLKGVCEAYFVEV